jgi:3-oxoacyl-[acyl-carrier-protein] synthase-3
MVRVQLKGTGSALPGNEISTEAIAELVQRYVPDKGAAWAQEKLGIETRRFATRLDAASGHPIDAVDELDLAFEAARAALQMSDVSSDRIGGLWLISCTQSDKYRHFSRACLDLHTRLGLPAHAFALEMDAGCGGGIHALAHASQLIAGGAADNGLSSPAIRHRPTTSTGKPMLNQEPGFRSISSATARAR